MKKTLHSLLLLLAFAVSSLAGADVNIHVDRVYGHKDGMALVYDVLIPDNANGAAVVYMVSGGWYSRWSPPATRERQFADLLAAGFTVIPVHHGSAPRYHVPDAYTDVSRAIRHIKLHAATYGIDPERLGVTGGSAGGHLSLMLGLASKAGDPAAQDPVLRQDNHVAAVVAYYPPVDLRSIVGPNERFPALNFAAEQAPSISPILHADAGDPPTLLIHGDADELVDISNSEIMFAEFERQGVQADFITIPGAEHGFRGDDARQAAVARLAWFEQHLATVHSD
ncbi:MAG: alpha/beta hydrolase [Pseudohongiellaceae bacterium]